MYRIITDSLVASGAVTPTVNRETWHGRAAPVESAGWQIDPNFDNGGYQSGRKNHCARLALYTGDRDCAMRIAQQRVKQLSRRSSEPLIPTVHKITPASGSLIALSSFSPDQLTGSDRKEYRDAIYNLVEVTSNRNKTLLAEYCIRAGLPAVISRMLSTTDNEYVISDHITKERLSTFTYDDVKKMMGAAGIIGLCREARSSKALYYCVNFTDLTAISAGPRQTS